MGEGGAVRIVALDTETFRIGPGAIAPKMVCFATAERIKGAIETVLTGNGDLGCEARLRSFFEAKDIRLVFHNGAYDLAVIATSYPALEPVIWAAVEDGRVTDTLLRERLLCLSTHGHLDSAFLPDGTAVVLKYNLAVLTMKYLGIDISGDKEGDDIWRLNFDTLDGLRADQYPRDAAAYAVGDPSYTLQIYEAQEQAKEIEGSTETEFFQTACSFALRLITLAGMPTDPERFEETRAMLKDELSEEKLGPLVAAGIMRPIEPARPHARQARRVVELLTEWTGDPKADPLAFQAELEGAGIKFTEEVPSGIKKEPLLKRVMATILAEAFVDTPEVYLNMDLDEMVALAEASGIAYKKTETGAVCADSEVIDAVADSDEVLAVYQHRQSLQKLVSTEIPRMMWDGKLAPRVHWPYKTLLETGRTSSSADDLFPSGNGQQIHPKVRPIFKPERGLFCSIDYATLELVCVAQVTLDKFGYSKHAEKINAGYDLHAYLGAQLARRLSPHFRALLTASGINHENADDVYDCFRSLKQDEPDFYKHWRKFAKPIGLGFPGGLGPYKILTLAKKTYGVDIVAEAEKLFAEHPEVFDRQNGSVLYWAKKLYGWEKTSDQWTPVLKGIALAAELREVWFQTYPEMREYLKVYLGKKSRRSFEEDAEQQSDYSYVSPFGMVRAGCTYTSAANGECMQTPAAEGFKTAVFNTVKECRLGSLRGRAQVINEIHDEIIFEIFDPADAHDVAMVLKEIMEESMRVVIRDVKVKAEPCLMERWHKEAEPVYKDKILVPWRPKAPAPVPTAA
jgi:DNA polymerase family A/3'-5' exonuclease